MRLSLFATIACAVVTSISPIGRLQAQGGSYAAASEASPWTMRFAGGMDIVDDFGDGAFPFGSIRVGRDFGRFVNVEGSAGAAWLSYKDFNISTGTAFQTPISQYGLDATIQLQLPLRFLAPYVGVGEGYTRISANRYSASASAYSHIALAGLRVNLSPRLFLGTEMRGKFTHETPGHAREVEMGGSVGIRF